MWSDSRVGRHLHSSAVWRPWRSFQATTRHARGRRQATTTGAAIVSRPRVTSFARYWRHRVPPGHVTARRMTETLTSLTASRCQGNDRSIFWIFVGGENPTQSNEFVGEFKGFFFKNMRIIELLCCAEKSLFFWYLTYIAVILFISRLTYVFLRRREGHPAKTDKMLHQSY